MTKEKQFSFYQRTEKTKIHAVKWMPEAESTGQSCRSRTAWWSILNAISRSRNFLNDQGGPCGRTDHLGHGASVASEEELGYFAEPDRSDTLVEDMHAAHDDPDREPRRAVFYDGTQHGILHAAQIPVNIHPEGVAGAVIMGTGAMPDSTMKFGLFYAVRSHFPSVDGITEAA